MPRRSTLAITGWSDQGALEMAMPRTSIHGCHASLTVRSPAIATLRPVFSLK
jgi:hypothetical protein